MILEESLNENYEYQDIEEIQSEPAHQGQDTQYAQYVDESEDKNYITKNPSNSLVSSAKNNLNITYEASTSQMTNITNTISLSFTNTNTKNSSPDKKNENDNKSSVLENSNNNYTNCGNYNNFNNNPYIQENEYPKIENEDCVSASNSSNNNKNNIGNHIYNNYNNYEILNIKDTDENFPYSDYNLANSFNFDDFFLYNNLK